ncbi:MAG: pirin-like C-terminal cupin domain-containing protein, partial [Isosphaeraceae bacterium]
PVVASGPFIMNDRAQIDDAIARYRAGRMGKLAR